MPNREKAIKGLEMCLADEYCDGCPYEKDCFDPDIDNHWGSGVMRDALVLLKEQPEIVRCKDCKHGSIYMTEDVCGKILIECNHPELVDAIAIHAWDWFCADGERKDSNAQ